MRLARTRALHRRDRGCRRAASSFTRLEECSVVLPDAFAVPKTSAPAKSGNLPPLLTDLSFVRHSTSLVSSALPLPAATAIFFTMGADAISSLMLDRFAAWRDITDVASF